MTLNSCMMKDRYGNVLLTPEASLEYWSQALKIAKADGKQEMTIDEFDEYLQVIDEELIQKQLEAKLKLPKPPIERPKQHDKRDISKASNIRRLNPCYSALRTEEIIALPDYDKFNTGGVLGRHNSKSKKCV